MVTLAVTVFNRAGPLGVAFVGAARMLPVIAFGLISSAPLARWRADRVLMALAAVRGLAAGGTAAALFLGGPTASLYLIAAVLGATAAMMTPTQYTVLPALARSPRELVVGNVATSTSEAIGSFGGPLLAGLCLGLGAAAAAGVIAALVLAAGFWLLAGVRFEHQADASGPATRGRAFDLGLGASLAAIRRSPAIGLVMVGFALQTLVRGLLSILLVVLSIERLGTGEAGVGLLTAAIGFGGAFGMIGGLMLRRATPRAFAAALLGWGLPIVVIGSAPAMAIALPALALLGVSNALLDVIGYTLLQRWCTNEDRGPVIALLEAAVGIGAAVGSLAAPALLGWLGIGPALMATGAILPTAAAVLLVLLRRSDAGEVLPGAVIEGLRRVPAFRALPLTGLERLIAGRSEIAFVAGEVLMQKGDPGDRFLVIEEGSVEVTDEGRVLNSFGPGASLGEIALLRGGPRTATVTALTDGRALSFDAATFLAAVAGPGASAAAEHVVETRLEHSRAADTA
jgi:MFS family permease